MSGHRHAYVGHEPTRTAPLKKYRVPLETPVRVVAVPFEKIRGLELRGSPSDASAELQQLFPIPYDRAPYWAGRETVDGVELVAAPCPCGEDALSRRVDKHPTGALARRLEDQDDELERQVREDVLELLERARGKEA